MQSPDDVTRNWLITRDWVRAQLGKMGCKEGAEVVEKAMTISREMADTAITHKDFRATYLALAAAITALISGIPDGADQENLLRTFIIIVQRELGFDVLRRKSDDVFLRMFDRSMNRAQGWYHRIIIVGIVSAAAGLLIGFLIGFWSA
jgi:hypothetical protein